MEIIARRAGEQLVLSLSGRMDGTGAQQVASALQQNLNDHDTAIIFDLGGVDYLSSAGLRVLQDSIRKMKERKGQVAVCRLQEFVRKLLTSGGFIKFLPVYTTVDDALAGTRKKTVPSSGGVQIAGTGWALTAEHLSDKLCTLSVTGNMRSVHDGKVTIQDVQATRGCSKGFCIGIGAMGKDRDTAAPLLGEMISLGGTVYCIPTDGHLTSDFFTAEDVRSSGMKSFSVFNVAFTGPFTDMIRISSEKPEGISLSELYEGIFRYAKQKYPDYSGVCAVAMKATIGGLCSSDMKTSLLAACADQSVKGPVAMPVGKTVTGYPFEGTVPEKISVVDVKPKYAGDALISVGYGIDLPVAQQAFPPETLSMLFYTDARAPVSGAFLYNKGAVFKNFPWDNAADFESQIASASDTGEFITMHNLLTITTVKSALVGISPVSSIRKET